MKLCFYPLVWLAAASLFASPQAVPSAGAAAGSGEITGKVVEVINAASYTYVQVDTGSKKVWAAATQFPVKSGDAVTLSDAMAMNNYHSKTLNRTFDVVYFSGRVAVNGRPAGGGMGTSVSLPPGHATNPHGPMGNPHGGVAGAPTLDLKGIIKAVNGQTVAEVYAGKSRLGGKAISVRGRVVKFNANIMGKNWLHIRDGSGGDGTNDLTVTTSARVKVGDLVLVNGKLSVDRDFGAGYKYGLIVEDAQVVVE